MERNEISERSPLRLLERSIRGGLGTGNIGVVVGRHGIGKTAFLVGVGLDDLMRGRRVLHFSLEHPLERVCDYYDEIFVELAHSRHLEDVWRVRLDVERGRRIHCVPSREFSVDKTREALDFLRSYNEFVPSTILLDGVDFERLQLDELAALRTIAREQSAELWMSAVTDRDRQRNARGVPDPVARLEPGIDVILTMAHDGNSVHVGLRKDHDNPEVPELRLALDPTTMLLVEE